MTTAEKIMKSHDKNRDKYPAFFKRLENGDLTRFEKCMLKVPLIPNKFKKFKMLAEAGVEELPTFGLMYSFEQRIQGYECSNDLLQKLLRDSSSEKSILELKEVLKEKPSLFSAWTNVTQGVTSSTEQIASKFSVGSGKNCYVKSDVTVYGGVRLDGAEVFGPTILAMLHITSTTISDKNIQIKLYTVNSKENNKIPTHLVVEIPSWPISREHESMLRTAANLMDGRFEILIYENIAKLSLELKKQPVELSCTQE